MALSSVRRSVSARSSSWCRASSTPRPAPRARARRARRAAATAASTASAAAARFAPGADQRELGVPAGALRRRLGVARLAVTPARVKPSSVSAGRSSSTAPRCRCAARRRRSRARPTPPRRDRPAPRSRSAWSASGSSSRMRGTSASWRAWSYGRGSGPREASSSATRRVSRSRSCWRDRPSWARASSRPGSPVASESSCSRASAPAVGLDPAPGLELQLLDSLLVEVAVGDHLFHLAIEHAEDLAVLGAERTGAGRAVALGAGRDDALPLLLELLILIQQTLPLGPRILRITHPGGPQVLAVEGRRR